MISLIVGTNRPGSNTRKIAARQLLLSGQQVKAVAFELGFKQPSHFCRQFKSFNNLTPSQFASQERV